LANRALQGPGKLEAVFEHVHVHQKARWHFRLHLSDDTGEPVVFDGGERGGLEFIELAHGLRPLDACRFRDPRQVGAGCGGGRKPAVTAGRAATY